MIKISEKSENIKFTIHHSWLFQKILIPENYIKQTLDESFTNKCQNHVGCCYGYKSLCVDDQFS